ncbi:MAG TPA: TonB family protein [Candidatus Udaeobacter sp.]|jgi:TonB family protein|nr:TonB family protein [Candidatus Udaeobacter sp.]
MKPLGIYVVVFAAMVASGLADTRKPYTVPMPYAPLPEYPAEARAKHWTGSGLFMIHADVDNGTVNGVNTVRSTGHSILDKAAETALYRWKFPHGVLTMMIPVMFTENGVQISYGAGAKKKK